VGERGWRLPSEDVKRLSRLRPHCGVLCAAFEWATILAAASAAEWSGSAVVYALTVLLIGSRMHALGVLMHEAAHYRLSPDRRRNEILGEILLAWPILVTLHGYRDHHFTHHRELNTARDPDWTRKLSDPFFAFPKTRRVFWLDVLKALVGIRFLAEARAVLRSNGLRNVPWRLMVARLAFYLAVVGALTGAGHGRWLLEYWLVPLVTSFAFFVFVRSVAEHHGGSMEYSHAYNHSRHVDPLWWERYLLAPYSVGSHLDHHLYPSVPWYHLNELHGLLLENEEYREKAHITKGYATGLVRECLVRASEPQRS
jgi:fatty acid desaturase